MPEPEVYGAECAHNSYVIKSVDFETLVRIPPDYSATVVLDQLDDVCVVGNTSKYYNFLKVETG